MKVFKPPTYIPNEIIESSTCIFLAGSIEMGKAEDWQTKIINFFAKKDNVTLINPRRESWDNSWVQSVDNPQFYEQVDWENYYLNTSDIIFMYFSPETKSPISLLELGLFHDSGKIMVVCPEGFWRKGNVDYVCRKYNIPEFETLDKGMVFLENNIM